MPTRLLGSTGLVVSPIGLGLAALGRPEYINLGRDADLGAERSIAEMERRSREMLDLAYAAGIRYVDAARSYGRAEQFLGSWLRRRAIDPASLTVGSKWGYAYTADWQPGATVHEIKDLSVATLQRQIVESREALGVHLRLYQIHSATLESGVLDDAGVLGALAQLRSDGLAIGLTVSGPRQANTIGRALAVSVDGVNPFQVVQATWNLLEDSAGVALAEAKARGCGVIVKEALANGRLTDRHEDAEVAVFRKIAIARGITVDALALGAALARPWADVVLSGAVTREQLESNLLAISLAESVKDVRPLSVKPSTYWKSRSQLQWD